MIDDMEYHVKAWYDILNNDLKAGLSWPQVREQMYGKNSELLVRVFGKRKFSALRMNELSFEKERRYQETYLPNLQLIPGLDAFMDKGRIILRWQLALQPFLLILILCWITCISVTILLLL